MNEVIRQKRKELNLTQEQIARQLGVSIPAVSKWESGVSYPDVSIIPALARVLKIDVNTLLCFNQELSDSEIAVIVNHIVTVAVKEDFEKAFFMVEEKIKEYPTDAQLIHTFALAMQGAMMMTELTEEQKELYNKKIIALYEKVGISENKKYADQSNYMLASRAIGERKLERAQELLDRLPEYNALDKSLLQVMLWLEEGRNGEASKICAGKILSAVNTIQIYLTHLIRIASERKDQDNAIELIKCGEALVENFGLWDYSSYLYSFEKATVEQDADEILTILNKMLGAILIPWDTAQSPVFQYIGTKKQEMDLGEKMRNAIITDLKKNPNYEFLRKNPQFEELIKKSEKKI